MTTTTVRIKNENSTPIWLTSQPDRKIPGNFTVLMELELGKGYTVDGERPPNFKVEGFHGHIAMKHGAGQVTLTLRPY